MTTRKTLARAIPMAGVVLVGVTALGLAAGPAAAAETYEDAVVLSWDGTAYAATTTVSMFGVPVSVPGDSATRTINVRNDGPTAGTLTARITNVQLRTPEADDIHHNPSHMAPDASGLYGNAGNQGNIYDDIIVEWAADSASMSTLDANGTTAVLTSPLARGEVMPVSLSYDFSLASTAGNQANVDLREASFDVELLIEGAKSAPPLPPEIPWLPATGGELSMLLLGVGALSVLGGAVLVLRSRRRTHSRGGAE